MLSHQTLPAFQNEPLTDFSNPTERQAMEAALAKVKSQLGQKYPMIIGGEEVYRDAQEVSINPARPDEVVGSFPMGAVEDAERAVQAAEQAFATWQYVDPARRAQYLLDAAKILRERKHEFSAWMVFEVGKTWPEADADTAETIDFLEYYAREMLRLAEPLEVYQMPGEHDRMEYIPLGAGVIIPPWNFAGAIPVGMSSAAIVTGNTIILKPAATAPTVSYQFVKLMQEVGLPPGVLNFLTGPGSKVGEALVDHPRTRFIAFTGSMEVGLRIHERAAKTQPGQVWIKRTVLEMGGKDAIVVDETADLDDAAKGIVTSAFGYQGQKCSACSRAIIVEPVYDKIISKILTETEKLTVGDPEDPTIHLGPVIDHKAYDKIKEYIEIGKREAKLAYGGESEGPGYFIEPTIFVDVKPDSRLAQEEIFGPVLSVIKARDWEDAMDIANGTMFGLTGAVYSHDPARVEDAERRFHVGNLYINRKCTGAMVGCHPFGGFNMSGTDSKTGGPDYLLLFLQAKSIARKLTPQVGAPRPRASQPA